MQEQISKVKQQLSAQDRLLYRHRNQLAFKEVKLAQAKRKGVREAAILEREVAQLRNSIRQERSSLAALRAELQGMIGEFVLPKTQQELISELDDSVPVLLLPLRIETRFMGQELWLRVFPDDVAVHTHELELTRAEVIAGAQFLIDQELAAAIEDAAEQERLKKGAWTAMTTAYGGPRSAWIVRQLIGTVKNKLGDEDTRFLIILREFTAAIEAEGLDAQGRKDKIEELLTRVNPVIPTIEPTVIEFLDNTVLDTDTAGTELIRIIEDGILNFLGYEIETLKEASWSRAPRSKVMPDRLVFIGVKNGQRIERSFPHIIPSPLILGPNPQELENELAQQGGDLVFAEDFAWMADFDQAVTMGMAIRIPLEAPFTEGFERIMVLGLRVSNTKEDNQADLQELIDNHHYSPDGLALLPQGTPTNNTDTKGSGFSVADPDSAQSFSIELGDPNFEMVSDELEKQDGQRLAEALGIPADSLHYIAHTGRTDISDAKIFNKALWPATWGYFLSEVLDLEIDQIKRIRQFFTEHVSGRGPLPAIRIGTQPYGLLVTSSFNRWQINEVLERGDAAFLMQLKENLTTIDNYWTELAKDVSHADAAGDPFGHLLNMLGLHAATVELYNRKGFDKEYWWNWSQFQDGSTANAAPGSPANQFFQSFKNDAIDLLRSLGVEIIDPGFAPPKIFNILFDGASTAIDYPLIDDVDEIAAEVFSETTAIKRKYQLDTEVEGTEGEVSNYIGWLVSKLVSELKTPVFINDQGEEQTAPKALLYRLLRRALLLANYEASMSLYESLDLVTQVTRKELTFINIKEERDVTRWEFMEANIGLLLPEAETNMTVADYLNTGPGVNLPEALSFAEVKACIAQLEDFETGRLERLLAEHLDTCSYRLDAWQTALFSKRLERLAMLKAERSEEQELSNTPYIGAFGWIENLVPIGPENRDTIPLVEVPVPLREGESPYEIQRNSGGFIHGPSINHAVAAAVLRNAYLTHFKAEDKNHFSVNLSSKRVRTAASFQEGVRNGQELGALLGYQFERNLHERYLIDGESLNQFILDFRTEFPLVADKITPDEDQDQIESKEARNVLDGYALLEATHLTEEKLEFPYGIPSLIGVGEDIKVVIVEEVEKLYATFDAISDLALAEGVFQVTQGNYDRAGAMLRALSEGEVIPEPEIIRTPRSGVTVNHKISLHLDSTATSSWGGTLTPRASIEPGLNHWLEGLIGPPEQIKIAISYTSAVSEAEDSVVLTVADLHIQAIDLVLLVGGELGQQLGSQTINDLTELENRIDSAFRRRRRAEQDNWDASGKTNIQFMSREGLESQDKTLFEILPLLQALQQVITSSRPLGADDYSLPSEESNGFRQNGNPKCWDVEEIQNRLKTFTDGFRESLGQLFEHIKDSPKKENGGVDPSGDFSQLDFEGVRDQLIVLSNYGIPNSYPRNAVFTHPAPTITEEESTKLKQEQVQLLEQAFSIHETGLDRHTQAETLRTFGHLSPEKKAALSSEQKVDIQRNAAKLVLGEAFQLIPRFTFKNHEELQQAFQFSNTVAVQESCLRFAQQQRESKSPNIALGDWRPFIIEDWLQGVSAVREKTAVLETISTFGEIFNTATLNPQILQLPFDEKAHWMAVEYPAPDPTDPDNTFVPAGEYLSIVPHVPSGYALNQLQSGLLIDEWNEVIPNKVETTGIALHYNQPNTEPPQTILLAVSPVISGNWDWEDLISVLEDTLDRAKKRAVEPDQLLNTPFAQLLPAILTSYTPVDFNTISTDLSNQVAVDVAQ